MDDSEMIFHRVYKEAKLHGTDAMKLSIAMEYITIEKPLVASYYCGN